MAKVFKWQKCLNVLSSYFSLELIFQAFLSRPKSRSKLRLILCAELFCRFFKFCLIIFWYDTEKRFESIRKWGALVAKAEISWKKCARSENPFVVLRPDKLYLKALNHKIKSCLSLSILYLNRLQKSLQIRYFGNKVELLFW